jgi:hypothetical protein
MRWLFAVLLVGALAWAIAFVPPRTAAKVAARGLKAGWDWVASVGPALNRRPSNGHQAQQKSTRKAQAAAPQRRTGREGIVPQPPKETLRPNDRAALDSLVANAR